MHAQPSTDHPPGEGLTHGDPLARLEEVIEHASHPLPAQGPITVFIDHNTLHGTEADELLVGGAVDANVPVGIGVLVASAFNGIAVLAPTSCPSPAPAMCRRSFWGSAPANGSRS